MQATEVDAIRTVARTATDEAGKLPEHSQIRRFLIKVGLELDGLHDRVEREGTSASLRSSDRPGAGEAS